MTDSERFWSKVNKDGPVHPVLKTACWVWTGALDTDGYGRFGFQGKNAIATRIMYFLMCGWIIPRETSVLHRCDNPPCVRPTHHFLGTRADNARDRDLKGRCRAGIRNRQKTHCPQRHEYTAENTRTYHRDGAIKRQCITCDRSRALARYQKERTAP